jgi:hypothetical protein
MGADYRVVCSTCPVSKVVPGFERARHTAMMHNERKHGGMSVAYLRRTTMATAKRDLLNDIMDYEGGTQSEEDTVAMFQSLVDSGLVWKLQGHYGRTAMRMFEAGLVTQPEGKS